VLTPADEPIIRRALQRRVGKEPGVTVLDIVIKNHLVYIAVGILLDVDNKVIVRSRFDLPPLFDLRMVHNQADEIAEACKEARRTMAGVGKDGMPDKGAISEEFRAKGTGVRGFWPLDMRRPS
jgi:hypothetical protein